MNDTVIPIRRAGATMQVTETGRVKDRLVVRVLVHGPGDAAPLPMRVLLPCPLCHTRRLVGWWCSAACGWSCGSRRGGCGRWCGLTGCGRWRAMPRRDHSDEPRLTASQAALLLSEWREGAPAHVVANVEGLVRARERRLFHGLLRLRRVAGDGPPGGLVEGPGSG